MGKIRCLEQFPAAPARNILLFPTCAKLISTRGNTFFPLCALITAQGPLNKWGLVSDLGLSCALDLRLWVVLLILNYYSPSWSGLKVEMSSGICTQFNHVLGVFLTGLFCSSVRAGCSAKLGPPYTGPAAQLSTAGICRPNQSGGAHKKEQRWFK